MTQTLSTDLKGKKSDDILNMLNRIQEAKLTGALKRDEFSQLLLNIGKVFSNKILQGKVSKDEIESFKIYVSSFIGPNKDNYLAYPHQKLEEASKVILGEINSAERSLENRALYAQPMMELENKERQFMKLG